MNLLILFLVLMSSGKSESTLAKYSDSKIVSSGYEYFDDSNVIKKKLPVYNAISCIDNLLEEVVKANNEFYNPKKYFYSLSFKKEGEKRFLVIESGQFKSSKVFDYIGVIKISGVMFLCRGDIATDMLFKINNNSFLNVTLKRANGSKDFDYGIEPSLRGLYKGCNGIKINLEIYTQATLPGYKMEEQKG